MTSKLMSVDHVVSSLSDGMTIGIGGWGSRRKPMSIVRAIARSPLSDLTVVSFAGPDLGLLCAAGKVRRALYPFVSLDSIPLEPHFRAARQAGSIRGESLAPWLHGVAYRLALKVRADARRRQVAEAQSSPRGETDPPSMNTFGSAAFIRS